MKFIIGPFICIVLLGCTSSITNPSWGGGKIVNPGIYQLSDNSLIVYVYAENGFVRYKVEDSEGDIVIQYNLDISEYQRWAFYLDEKRDFWVFSSDIGHSVWRKMQYTYTEHTFEHRLTRGEVPEDVYIHCKEFLL